MKQTLESMVFELQRLQAFVEHESHAQRHYQHAVAVAISADPAHACQIRVQYAGALVNSHMGIRAATDAHAFLLANYMPPAANDAECAAWMPHD